MPRLALFAALLLSLAACDSSDSFVVGGTYSGVTEDLGTSQTTLTVEIPETESPGTFSFAATVAERGSSIRAAGTGTYDHPSIVLTVEGESAEGTVSDDGEEILLETEPGNEPALLTRR